MSLGRAFCPTFGHQCSAVSSLRLSEGVGHHALLVHVGEKDGPEMSAGISWEVSTFVILLMTRERAPAALAIVPLLANTG